MTLRAYMVYAGDSTEGASLVLAHTAKEARRLGFVEINDWLSADWIDTRVRWLRDADLPFLLEKFPDGPRRCDTRDLACQSCELWYPEPLTQGRCESCHEDLD